MTKPWKRPIVFLVTLGLGSLFASSAALAEARFLPGFEVGLEEWTLTPIFHKDEVESVVAIRDTKLALGENINVVWLRRDAAAKAWSKVAWEEPDPGNAIAYVEGLYAEEGILGDWPLADTKPTKAEAPSAPKAFGDGLFLDDGQNAEVAKSSDPKAYVKSLEDVGWAAATVPVLEIANAFTCTEVVILEAISAGFEFQFETGLSGEKVAADLFQKSCGCEDSLAASAALGSGTFKTQTTPRVVDERAAWPCCLPWTWTSGGPNYSCGATGPWAVSEGPYWVGGRQCSMTCWFEATGTCTCTRTRTRRKLNCKRCTWTQTGSYTGTIIDKSVEFFYSCVQPPGYACPTGPQGGGVPKESCGGWTPGAPC